MSRNVLCLRTLCPIFPGQLSARKHLVSLRFLHRAPEDRDTCVNSHGNIALTANVDCDAYERHVHHPDVGIEDFHTTYTYPARPLTVSKAKRGR
jgi:hypothetical protein